MNTARKKRVPFHLDVRINRMHPAEGLDLSADGMYVYTRHTVIEGAIVEILINVAGRQYDVQARVEHVQPGVGFGVSFIYPPDEMAERIMEIVECGGSL